MNEHLEEILSCADLPSLPAVAVRVIDLTSDVNVSLKELAETIQNDQGLSAKILKTINSSFYGLRQRCSTIDKALVLLGLGPVKSLALGFSLVQSIDDPDAADGFEYAAYWRRGLYSGVAGKLFADRLKLECADEVFLAGLLQDVGMIAMYRALGDRYLAVLAQSEGDHRELVRHELHLLDLQHPDIGAMLVQRWRLPEQLSIPVKFHERPSATPSGCADHVRCVGIGNLIHDVLSVEDVATPLRRLYERAKAWYDMTGDDVDEVIERARESTDEMASVFSLEIGGEPNSQEILDRASEQAIALTRAKPESSAAVGQGSVLEGSEFDALTGALGQFGFEAAILEAFRHAHENDDAATLLEVVIDGFDGLAESFGEGAELEAVMGVAALLKRVFEAHGGVVCRVSPAALAVVLPSMGRRTATELARQFSEDLERSSASWRSPSTSEPLAVSVCIGIASLESDTRAQISEPARLVVACARALRAAQSGGRGSTRVFEPRVAA